MSWLLALILPGCTWVGAADWEGRRDWDGDGVVSEAFGGLDCDDSVAAIRPGVEEVYYDGVDQNCDGGNDYDQDGDGLDAAEPGGSDCDDTDPDVFPGAREICDGVDTNCDGALLSDEIDADGDGWTLCAGDCDDTNPDVFPDAEEVCDDVGRDEDCDGLINDRDRDVTGATVWYRDADGDGSGDQTTRKTACLQPNGYLAVLSTEGSDEGTPGEGAFDCDDRDAGVSPAAEERCDGVDTDCDGLISEDETEDADGDGFPTCEDCAPDDPAIYPGAVEYCDGLQTSCTDGDWDRDEGLVSFVDGDGLWSTVQTGADDEPLTARIDQPGTLYVCDGEHYLNLIVLADLDIVAGGEGTPELVGGGVAPVVEIVDAVEVTIRDVVLSGGVGLAVEAAGDVFSAGGGVLCDAPGARVTLLQVVLEDNVAEIGGGVALVNGCAGNLGGVDASYNSADLGGGLFVQGVNLEINDSTFTGNIASFGGGVLALQSEVLIDGGSLDGNVATAGGGGLYALESEVALQDVAVLENASSRGGGLSAEESALSVTGGGVSENAATVSGGGLYAVGGALTLSDTELLGNRAATGGGAWLDLEAGAVISGTLFSGNLPDDLWKDGTVYNWSTPVDRECAPGEASCE